MSLPLVPLGLKLATLAVSGLAAVTLGEVAMRVTRPATVPPGIMLLSSPHLIEDEHGAVRHLPNEQVRMIVAFGQHIEFDVTVRTNSSGLVDHEDYIGRAPDDRSMAFVGNSFVYGMGAPPWVPELRDRLRNSGASVQIYNLGVNGASIQHFRRLLTSVATTLPIDHIVALPISNDFYRPWWVPRRDGHTVRMCRSEALCGRPLAVPIPVNVTRETALGLVEASLEAAEEELSPQRSAAPWWRQVLSSSEFYRSGRRAARQALQRLGWQAPEVVGLEDPALLDANLEALAGIRSDFPSTPITLVHVPQKEEVSSGRYSLALDAHASRLGMSYLPALTVCRWTVDMFHPLDGHPNVKGYDEVSRCLQQQLFSEMSVEP